MARGRPSRATIYARLNSAIAELNDRLGGLPSPKESEYIWSDIWHLEAHHSTALEGNTLVLREVEALLDKGRAVGAKPLREYLEVQGYGNAARWVYAHAIDPGDWRTDALISMQEVRQVHSLALSPVWQVAPHPDATDREGPGMFREHDIRPFGAGMTPPSWPLVPARVQDWIDETNAAADEINGGESPLPEILARLHDGFEKVHPFIDGNGRTGRLLLNLLLVRLGYPPIIVLKQQRPAYLTAMQRADDGDYGPLAEILARAMYDNLNRFIVPSLAGPARLVPLAALVDQELTLPALRQAVQRGRLDAIQGTDGVWRSSRKALEEYRRTRQRRRAT
jgi:cell filamentation protein, protein adenylyltransferase